MPLYSPMQTTQVIHIHARAPTKPALGAPCNGCGVCCLSEPCPLGIVLSGTRIGACKALRWHESTSCYVCGAMDTPYEVVQNRLPKGLAWLAKPLAAVLPSLARRWIAAGIGCDSSLQPLSLSEAPFGDNLPSPSQSHPQPGHSHD